MIKCNRRLWRTPSPLNMLQEYRPESAGVNHDSPVRESDVAGMDIQQRVTSRNTEHFRNMQRIGPSIIEQLPQMFIMLGHDVLAKIRDLAGKLRPGEIEYERTSNDGHLNRSQFLINQNELRHIMARNLTDVPLSERAVNIRFALESIQSVKEFDGGAFRCSPDGAVLARTGSKFIDAQSSVTQKEL